MSEEISAEIAVKCSGITKVFGSVVANAGIDLEVNTVRYLHCWAKTDQERPR